MRIITGEYRGRKLEAPNGMDVRPTSDMIKEAMFNILMNEVYGAICVDLFAGTGNLGLEALSRGAEKCYFCDNSRESIKFIKSNIDKCGAKEKSKVIFGDYMKCLQRMTEKADIFFVDPPYNSGMYEKVLESIISLDLLADDGIILTEHDKYLEVPEKVGNLEVYKERKYGKKVLTFYRKRVEGETEDE